DRLKPEALSVFVGEKSISDVTVFSVLEAKNFFSALEWTQKELVITGQIMKEINARLNFLLSVGLDYLTLDRRSETLAGGEAQRIHLATQIGSGLTGVLYVLDEPTIGLHPRDNARLLGTLRTLRDLGNTLIVVEHDEETIRCADWIIDLGPGAGTHGGRIVAQGTLKDILKSPDSETAAYLNGSKTVMPGRVSRRPKEKFLQILGASQFNLKNIDVKIPLGLFVCVSGVSGSGKSTLVHEVIYKGLARKLFNAKEIPGAHRAIKGHENIDKVIIVDQSPIGRTPRSNPATYTGVFAPIRDLFSELPEAKRRGYKAGRFSFNVKGGRCENCQGDGTLKIQMQFLPDVYVHCEECLGKRFNEETIQVKYKGRSIADVLDMSVEDAHMLFSAVPPIARVLKTLQDVGLGYIKLGQSATTLSGGEAQRVKLASELCRRATGDTLYMLDEPTTGLHFADVDKLLAVLHRLAEQGNTVLVIEHNLDVIRTADWIIDLGPEGGGKGGEVVAEGAPADIMANPHSHTGRYLKDMKHIHTPACVSKN
ncbi:MAG: excinuclease ABC subunit UvrA, partial [bacterium]